MAHISVKNDINMLKISAFLGLNENPDGVTALKTGELSEMRNFRITKDGHLQIRPGTKTILSLYDALSALLGEDTPPQEETHVRGVWIGSAGGTEHLLAAYGGYIWDIDRENNSAVSKGTLTDDNTHFFAFGGKVYLLNGHEYKAWDGGTTTEFADVDGYIPIVQTATTPDGAGVLLENVNRLTNKRRVEFSPDGTATVFHLPEKGIDDTAGSVSVTVGGTAVTGFTVDAASGTVTMPEAPAAGTNTMTVTYAKGTGARTDVTAMRFSELFNGSTDTRVFLYGDGTNRAIYSGIDGNTGEATAEYFPDLYEITVGEKNTPITALIRHYSRMMAFKPSSAWSIQYGSVSLESNVQTAAFYCQPVNRQLGNEAAGQAKLLENNPVTLDGGNVYQWKPNSGDGLVSIVENNAKRISDRISQTLHTFDMANVRTFNAKHDLEFWFTQGERAVVLNYGNNTWYYYDGLSFEQMVEIDGEKYGFSDGGELLHISRAYRNDNGAPIDCYAATGAMDFNKDWLLKYSPMLFVAMQPESNARVTVTVESNRRSDYPEKVVSYSLSTFRHMDFNHFSFATNRKPQVKRLKIKVKKATFYRIIFKSNSASATATVIETDVKLRYAGDVK